MIHIHARRTKVYRQYVRPLGYRRPTHRLTSLAIGPIMNLELKEMQHTIKQKKGSK